jgi:ComF family protein
MMKNLLQIPSQLFHLFYPHVCESCGEELVGNEKIICIACWKDLPKTKFHLQVNNQLEQKFWGRIHVQCATSMYFFNKDSRIQHVLHALKYRNNTDLGIELGRRFGRELEKCNWIEEIDVIIPIPLSKQKEKLRGYNQSEFIAKGMSEILNIEVNTQAVARIKHTDTQTKKSRTERLENMQAAFEVMDSKYLENKHILLVDDVITTGATLESCAETILKVNKTKLSIATLAYAIE